MMSLELAEWGIVVGIATPVIAGLAYLIRLVSERSERANPKLFRYRNAHDRLRRSKKKFLRATRRVEQANSIVLDLIGTMPSLAEDRIRPNKLLLDYPSAIEAVDALTTASPRTKIIIVLHGYVGCGGQTELLLRAIASHRKKSAISNPRREPQIVAYVPYLALNGGTLIALACDKVVLQQHALLSSVYDDTDEIPRPELESLVESKGTLATNDDLVVRAASSHRRHLRLMQLARGFINPAHRRPSEDRNTLADALTGMEEGRVLSPKEAHDLGINVSAKLPSAVVDFARARIYYDDAQEELNSATKGM